MLKGSKHTEETKRKLSEACKGEKHWIFGKHHSEETKIKLSESKMGKRNPNWGKPITPEVKKKISEALRGEKNYLFGKHLSVETRKKLSEAHKGQHPSLESRIKRSISMSGEKHYNWKGGKSLEPYGVEFNRRLKEFIRKRDKYRCKECFIHQDNLYTKKGKPTSLHVHHIDYNKKNNVPNNLISLCYHCHLKTNFKREDWTNYFNLQYNNSDSDSDSVRTAL